MGTAPCSGAGYFHIVSSVFIIHVLGNVLIPAQNVTLSSKNFSLFLTWTPPEEHPPQSTYSVEIMPKNVWIEPANCKFPSEKICDITCTIKNCYSMYKARVRSFLPETPVVWMLSNGFIPLDDVELGPPQMEIDVGEESLMVHLQIKLIQCKRKVLDACLLKQLTYEVEIWDANAPVRRPIKQSVLGKSMEIAKHELRGHSNCISARSVYQSLQKFSSFSEPFCFTLEQEERQTEKYLAIMGSALGILFLVSVAAAIVRKVICIPSDVKMLSALVRITLLKYYVLSLIHTAAFLIRNTGNSRNRKSSFVQRVLSHCCLCRHMLTLFQAAHLFSHFRPKTSVKWAVSTACLFAIFELGPCSYLFIYLLIYINFCSKL